MTAPIKVQRVDFSASDWLGGTATLSLQESGLYITICALIYVAGGPVSKADVRKVVASVRTETFNSILLRLIEKGKISFENGLIDQARCERELAKARRRIASRSRTGVESDPDPQSDPETESASQSDTKAPDWEPLVLNEINGVNDPLTRGTTYQPTITSQKPKKASSRRREGTAPPPPDPVGAIFDRGLKILGPNHRRLLGKFRQTRGDEAVLEAILACEAAAPSDPVAFFLGCLKRAPPARNGHDKDSAVTKLYRGAMRAADKLDREEADRRAGRSPAQPLLDSG